jgi:hypothetical protein
MSMPFQAESHHGAPKRSNSGRQIVYVFPPTGASAVNTSTPPPDTMPPDVAQALELLRNYSFRDIYRWLKLDRQDGTAPLLPATQPHVSLMRE